MKLGYARVSSTGQSLDIQLDELHKAGVERIFGEKVSGTSMEGRDEMEALLTMLRPGDEVYATRLDRLARSVPDFLRIATLIEQRGASLHLIQQAIETKTAIGRMCATFIAAFAQFETELRRERQREGIDKAKAANRYKLQPRGKTHSRDKIRQLFDAGKSDNQIAKSIRCTRRTVIRIREEIGLVRTPRVTEEKRARIAAALAEITRLPINADSDAHLIPERA